MTRIGLSCVLSIFLLTTAVRSQDTSFQQSKKVELPSLEQEELVAIALDSDVYDSTRDNLADLRVLDSKGTDVPFILQWVETIDRKMVRTNWTAAEPVVRPLPEGGLEIDLVLKEDDPNQENRTRQAIDLRCRGCRCLFQCPNLEVIEVRLPIV